MAWKFIFLLFCSLELRYLNCRNIANIGKIKSQKFQKQSLSAIYVKILHMVSVLQVVLCKSCLPPFFHHWWGPCERDPHFLIITAHWLSHSQAAYLQIFLLSCTRFWECREDWIPALKKLTARGGEGHVNLGQTVSLTLTSLDLIPQSPVILDNNLLTWLPLAFFFLRPPGAMKGVSSW